MKKTILFDLDGTLLNTIEDIRYILNTVITKYGYKALDTNTTLGFVGRGAKYLVSKAITATKDQYEADLADINEQASEDKNAMMNVFLALGGTSISSILAENLIKSFNESDDDGTAVKKALKCFAICCCALTVRSSQIRHICPILIRA